MDADAQALDAWGLPIIPPAPPPADDELGLTTTEDGDWVPTKLPHTVSELVACLVLATIAAFKFAVIRSGIHMRRRHP